MKSNFPFIMLLVCTMVSAQDITDVLRYSSENIQGTARFQSMGGAFGALGGDLSALNSNPAGSAVFNNSLFTVSGTHYTRDNLSTYFNNSSGTSLNEIDLNQLGAVFVFKTTDPDSDWKKVSFAINYDLVENFDNEVFIAGNSNQGVDNYFLNFAQGVPFGSILVQEGEFLEDAYLDIGAAQGFVDQQAFLGYYGGLIDPADMDDATSTYVSNANYSTVNQDFFRSSSGYNSRFTLNIASQYQETLYLGASLNFHNVVYDQFDQFTETGYDPDSEIQRTTFDNLLHTEGNGFSFSLGAIAKLNELVRIGGSYQSPTWYRLTDDFSQRINSDLADEDINFINFNVVNLFEPYRIQTPAKLTGSLALVFGKNGLLSFDYSYQDMSQAELRPVGDPAFITVNDEIAGQLGEVSTIRVGGEYRIERFSLRGGYRFEQSPYVDGNLIGDLQVFSGGVGYTFGASRLDLAVSRAERDTAEFLFDTGFPTPALVNRLNTNVTLGYTLNF